MPEKGKLWVVATPIGNLSDLSARVRQTLEEVDRVAAEDTRRTRKLLTHLGLRKPLLRCDEENERRLTGHLLNLLGGGENVAFVTDSGTPAISDPGTHLVNRVLEEGFTVIPIPGPSAVSTLLSVCGFRSVPYQFFGFLNRKGKKRKEQISKITGDKSCSVFFESPYRVGKTLTELAGLQPDRRICVGRELTKVHEEVLRGTLAEMADRFGEDPARGEFTVVVAPLEEK